MKGLGSRMERFLLVPTILFLFVACIVPIVMAHSSSSSSPLPYNLSPSKQQQQQRRHRLAFVVRRGGATTASDVLEEESEYDDESEEEEEEEDGIAVATDDESEEDEDEDEEEKDPVLASSVKKRDDDLSSSVKAKTVKTSKTVVNASLAKSRPTKKKSPRFRLRLPYIVRACLNPFTAIAMTKAYFASLFDISYTETATDPSQNLRSALQAKAKGHDYGGNKKGKRSMKPGRSKSLSDLPQLSA